MTVFGTLREAWSLTKTVSWKIRGSLLIAGFISIVLLYVVPYIFPVFPNDWTAPLSHKNAVIVKACYLMGTFILSTGLVFSTIAITLQHNAIFRTLYFRFIPALLTLILSCVIVLLPMTLINVMEFNPGFLHFAESSVGFFVLVPLSGIWIFIATVLMLFSVPLAIDEFNNPLKAIYGSLILTKRHFLTITGVVLFVLLGFVFFCLIFGGLFYLSPYISMIGFVSFMLIQYLPFMFLVVRLLYRQFKVLGS